jgi:anti-sigma factor RsiW
MKPIVCASGVELLMDYLEGVLPAEVRAAVDAHVAGCPRCVAFIASYRETPRILREATAMSMPADLQESLLASLRHHRGESPADE